MNLLRRLFRRSRMNDEVREEMESHIAMRAELNEHSGMSAKEARVTARRQFGNAVAIRERIYERNGFGLLTSIVRDLQHAVRSLMRSKTLVAVAVLSLIIAIGANTAIFSLLNAILLRPLPIQDPYRLVSLSQSDATGRPTGLNEAMIRELGRQTAWFSAIFGRSGDRPVAVEYNNLVTAGNVYAVSSNFYSGLGIDPFLGRVLTADDDAPAGATPSRVAVLGYQYWQQHFSGDRNILGKTIRLDHVAFTIVGVTGKEYSGLEIGQTQQITILVGSLEQSVGEPDPRLNPAATPFNDVVARLASGISLQAVRAALSAEAPRLLAATIPPGSENRDLYRQQRLSLDSGAMGSSGILQMKFERPLRILMSVVALLLLIACVNLANLMLARALSKRRELGILAALGAGRAALVRHTLAETVVLAILGVTGGFALAHWLSPVLAQRAWVGVSPIDLNLSTDLRVLGFDAALTIFTISVVGITAAVYASRSDPAHALQSVKMPDARTARWSRMLLIAQIALSLVLIVMAGLFAQSLAKLRSRDFGFPVHEVLNVLVVPEPGPITPVDWASYSTQLESNLTRVPGVRTAALTGRTLMDGSFKVAVSSPQASLTTAADATIVTAKFFRALDLSTLEGRTFDDRDNHSVSNVAVISETLAHRLFPKGTSIGNLINAGAEPTHQGLRIIGVVSDALLHDTRQTDRSDVYLPASQQADSVWSMGCLIVRTSRDPSSVAAEVQKVVQSLDRQYVFVSQTTEERISRLLVVERMFALLGNSLSGVSLMLVAIGLFGLTAYNVSRRTSEIGVRVALGATRSTILWLFLGQTSKVLAVGLTVGIFSAILSGRFISTVVFGISPQDPVTIIGSTLVLIGVAILATYVPVRHAALLNPTVTLRHE